MHYKIYIYSKKRLILNFLSTKCYFIINICFESIKYILLCISYCLLLYSFFQHQSTEIDFILIDWLLSIVKFSRTSIVSISNIYSIVITNLAGLNQYKMNLSPNLLNITWAKVLEKINNCKKYPFKNIACLNL